MSNALYAPYERALFEYMRGIDPAFAWENVSIHADARQDLVFPSYPEMRDEFCTILDALAYLFEEGHPIWLCARKSGFPLNVFTLDKAEWILSEHVC